MSANAAFTDSQKWLLLAALLACGWLIHALAPVLTPFLISALLAYLGDPVVDRLEALHLSRTASVTIVFAVLLTAGVIGMLFLVPAIERQVVVLFNKLPLAIDWLQARLVPWFAQLVGLDLSIDTAAVKTALADHWRDVGSLARNIVTHLSRSGQLVLGWLAYLLLVPVVTFYLLRDWDILVAKVHDLLPRRVAPRVSLLAREIDDVLAEFLRGQLTVMLALAVLYIIGLWLVGLELAFIVGLIAGAVSFVPYLGVIVGVVLAGASALLQFQDGWHLLGVLAVFGVGQVLEGMVLSPLLVGDRIGLHPVAVIFAVMAGGQLFGFIGVLLALPVAAIVVVLLRHSHDEYKRSVFYGPEPDDPELAEEVALVAEAGTELDDRFDPS